MIFSRIKKYFKSLKRHISHQFFDEVLLKKKGMETRSQEIEILAMGSSHCTRGFNPNILKNAYNFGIMDQDLYTTHCLFDQYINSLKNLKHLIIFYSIHSQGHELAKTKSFKTMAIHHAIFGISYPIKEISKWNRAISRRFKTFNDSDINYKNFTGFIMDKREVCAPPTEFRVSHHLRENQRPIKQNHHLFEILRVCLLKGIKPVIVIAPTRLDFIQELKKFAQSDDQLFHDVFKYCKENNIPILNELRSKDFDWDDFMDSDHLNPKGATKLTKKIAKLIGVKAK